MNYKIEFMFNGGILLLSSNGLKIKRDEEDITNSCIVDLVQS